MKKRQPAFKQKQQATTANSNQASQGQLDPATLELVRSYEARMQELTRKEQQASERATKVEQERKAERIRNELRATAKKLNVRDTVMEDLLALVGQNFQVLDDKVKSKDKPDLDPEKYLTEWLEPRKEAYLTPQAAPGTGASPFPSAALPTPPKPDVSTPMGALAHLAQKFGQKKQ